MAPSWELRGFSCAVVRVLFLRTGPVLLELGRSKMVDALVLLLKAEANEENRLAFVTWASQMPEIDQNVDLLRNTFQDLRCFAR